MERHNPVSRAISTLFQSYCSFHRKKNLNQDLSFLVKRAAILLFVLFQFVVSYGQVTTTFTVTLGGGANNWTAVVWVKTGDASFATYPGETGYAGENAGDIHHVVIQTNNPAARTLTLNIPSITNHVGDVTINNAPGTATLDIGNNSLTMSSNLSGAGTLQSASGTLYIAGNNTHTGTYSVGTGSMNYNGSGAQTVRGVPYYNLTISGSGTKTMGAALTVNGNLAINGSAILATNTYQITGNLFGTFTMTAGTGLNLGNSGFATAV